MVPVAGAVRVALAVPEADVEHLVAAVAEESRPRARRPA